jgi:hypothetical protein
MLLKVDTIDVNIRDKEGRTALMIACANGHDNIVEMMLKVDTIDVNIRAKEGRTALMCACAKGNDNIVEMLLKVDTIDVNIRHIKVGKTALMFACNRGHDVIVARLIDHGVELDGIEKYVKEGNIIHFCINNPVAKAVQDLKLHKYLSTFHDKGISNTDVLLEKKSELEEKFGNMSRDIRDIIVKACQ